MAKEEYEVIPHKLLSDLKYDVEALKKKLTEPDQKVNELILEIESLKDSIHDLNNVFTKALEHTKEDDVVKTINILKEKMDTVVNQNETIAQGMIAISDKVEDWMNTQNQSQIRPMQPQMSAPPSPSVSQDMPDSDMTQRYMGPPARTAPQMQSMDMPQANASSDFPPPPPNVSKKRSLGGLFK
jgi:hypothetical protein